MGEITSFIEFKEAAIRDGTYWERMANGRDIMLQGKKASNYDSRTIVEKQRKESNDKVTSEMKNNTFDKRKY